LFQTTDMLLLKIKIIYWK